MIFTINFSLIHINTNVIQVIMTQSANVIITQEYNFI